MIETIGAYNVNEIPGLKELWSETQGDPRICIAVLDGPVDNHHPSLAAVNLTNIATLVSGAADRQPASHHGTHIASVIFGQHDGPIKGIAPRCRGLIIPVFTNSPEGAIAPCSQIDLARAISLAMQHGAHVINISGGEFSSSGTAHPLLSDVVRDCANKGVLLVAAAGNQGCQCLHIPGALPSVLAVGAMNANGEPLGFSNWGEKYREQGILAPGENILGAIPLGGVATNSGTSFATPIVSGLAALLLSLQLQRGQKLDHHLVRAAILSSALGCEEQPVPNCKRLLVGRLNVKGAHAEIIKKGESTMTDLNKREDHSSQAIGVQAATSDETSRELPNNELQQLMAGKPEVRASQPHTQVVASHVAASGCGCGGGSATPQLVFAIGQLSYDFGTEARRDSIMQHMEPPAGSQIPPNPHDPRQLLAHFEKYPADIDSINVTLTSDSTILYVIKPKDAFAMETYLRLRQFLHEQAEGEIERISLGGIIYSSARLLSGQVVPALCPNLRCMNSWNTNALIKALIGRGAASSQQTDDIRNFLERVYYELRNLGIDACHRAINYAATNALNVAKIFEAALKDNMQLDSITCEPSPYGRPGSDCREVRLTFFPPKDQLNRARQEFRFTVDVSDICPVMVGPVRSWSVR